MSDNDQASVYASGDTGGGGGRTGVHFIALEEISDVSEETPEDFEDEEQHVRRRLSEAVAGCRETKELHEKYLKHELELEGLINETEAENTNLRSNIRDLQQEIADQRMRREEKEAEALQQQLLSKEERRSRFIYLRTMEKDNEMLSEANEDLTAQLEQLSRVKRTQEELQSMRDSEPQLKHKLEDLQVVLRRKDKQIEENSVILLERGRQIKAYLNTVEVLRHYQRELRKQLDARKQEQMICVSIPQEEPTASIQPLDLAIMIIEKSRGREMLRETGKYLLVSKGWLNWLDRGFKVAKVVGAMALTVGLMDSLVPVNTMDPDCNPWHLVVALLEPYCELHHILPPVF